jgi:hypothetical protein
MTDNKIPSPAHNGSFCDNKIYIHATIRTDDFLRRANFDALGWFERATDADVIDLHAARYSGDEADSLAYYAVEQEKQKGVKQLFGYLERFRPRTMDNPPRIIGFEVTVDRDDVRAWLKRNRAHLAAQLFPGTEPCCCTPSPESA